LTIHFPHRGCVAKQLSGIAEYPAVARTASHGGPAEASGDGGSVDTRAFFDIEMLWDDPPSRHGATVRPSRHKTCLPMLASAGEGGTPDTKFPGGHRSRVTPVPIPNTEVKLATADGTACEGAWESRSLPGLFHQKGSKGHTRRAFLSVRVDRTPITPLISAGPGVSYTPTPQP
jgi:hypothetical protein